MAKIKLAGYGDLITIAQDKATKIKNIWKDDLVSPDEKIDVGTTVFIKSQIKAIFLDEDIQQLGQKFKSQLKEYYVWRDNLLTLSPRQRAEQCTAWGMFSMFFRGVYGYRPKEIIWKEKVLQEVTKFFEQNPEWAKPSFEVFQKMLELKDADNMNKTAISLLARIQSSELQDIEQTKRYVAGKVTREEVIDKMTDEINVEELFTNDDL